MPVIAGSFIGNQPPPRYLLVCVHVCMCMCMCVRCASMLRSHPAISHQPSAIHQPSSHQPASQPASQHPVIQSSTHGHPITRCLEFLTLVPACYLSLVALVLIQRRWHAFIPRRPYCSSPFSFPPFCERGVFLDFFPLPPPRCLLLRLSMSIPRVICRYTTTLALLQTNRPIHHWQSLHTARPPVCLSVCLPAC